jgi:hypothetical protein
MAGNYDVAWKQNKYVTGAAEKILRQEGATNLYYGGVGEGRLQDMERVVQFLNKN